MLQYREFALLGSMRNTGQIWIAELDCSGTMEFRRVIPAHWWWATSWAAHGCWRALQCSLIPTNSLGHREGPYTVFTNSHRALELQTSAKLTSWSPSSSTPWKPLLPSSGAFHIPLSHLGIPGLPLLPPPLPAFSLGWSCWKSSLSLGWQHPRPCRQPATTLSSLSSLPHAVPAHHATVCALCQVDAWSAEMLWKYLSKELLHLISRVGME